MGIVYVRKTRSEDLPEFWSIIEEQGKEKVFPYGCSGYGEFFARICNSFAVLTCIDDKQVVGGAWLERTRINGSADIVIFKRKGYANPFLVRRICREALPSLFLDHNLTDITGKVMEDNKGVIALMKAVGFHILHYCPDGVLVIGIGREEVLGDENQGDADHQS